MAPTVLVYPRFPPRMLNLVSAEYNLLSDGSRLPAEAFTPAERSRVTALVTSGGRHNSRQFMDALPNLRLIACYGTGYDGVDLEAAREKGITVCNSPGANAASVADQAIALALAATRGIPRADAFVRRGDWASQSRPYIALEASLGLTGTRVGVYGMGEIGEKIARRMMAFEAEVRYHSRSKRGHLPFTYHATLESLVEWCDVLIIAVRAGEDNRHVIDQAILERLGPDGYVINVSRGLVIDEEDLIGALENGTIAGAGLDVFQNEPNIRPEFLALANVVMTPHQGGDTRQAHERMQDTVMANLHAFFTGHRIPHPVRLD